MGDYYVNEHGGRSRSASPSGWQQLKAAGIVWLLLGLPMLLTVLILRIVIELLARVLVLIAVAVSAWRTRHERHGSYPRK